MAHGKLITVDSIDYTIHHEGDCTCLHNVRVIQARRRLVWVCKCGVRSHKGYKTRIEATALALYHVQKACPRQAHKERYDAFVKKVTR